MSKINDLYNHMVQNKIIIEIVISNFGCFFIRMVVKFNE